MRHKVAELDGALLDLAVAIAEGDADMARGGFTPSKRWHDGGPIIERERISTSFDESEAGTSWIAYCIGGHEGFGPTPLVAAMRAFVDSRVGEEIELP